MTDTNYDLGFREGIETASRVALNLEERWRNSAKRSRTENRRWFFGWFVPSLVERDARTIEAAADGIKAIRTVLATRKPKRTDDGETRDNG